MHNVDSYQPSRVVSDNLMNKKPSRNHIKISLFLVTNHVFSGHSRVKDNFAGKCPARFFGVVD
jgi:hypothetical protein